MANYLKRPFIMFLIFSCFVVGWQTISGNAIFSGVAMPFVGIIMLLGLLTYTVVVNKEVRHRVLDLYILACVFAVLEFVVYLVLEFGLTSIKMCFACLGLFTLLTSFSAQSTRQKV